MINELNQRLQGLAERRARAEKLRRQVAELEGEYRQAEQSAKVLKRTLGKEERDVERLEGVSLTGLLASLFGTREEKLDRERQEAAAAQLRYGEAKLRAERLGTELGRIQKELADLGDVETEYQELLGQKERLIRAGSDQGAREIDALAEEEQAARWRLKELADARRAGGYAESALAEVASSLDSAASWGTWDMLGGGLIATAAKHSHIDEAKQRLYAAQEALARFRRELKDLEASLSLPEVDNLDGFTRFADYFFDGLFADIAVQSRINESRHSVDRSLRQVSELLNWIKRQEAQTDLDLKALVRRKQRLVESYQGRA